MWNKDYFDRIARGELMRRQMTNYRMTNDEGSPNAQMTRQHAARVSFGLCPFSRSVTPLLGAGDFVGQLVTAASLFRGEFGRQDVSDLLNRFDQCIGKLFIPKMTAHFIDQAMT